MSSKKKQQGPSKPPSQQTTDLPIHSFSTAQDFEEFLEREHQTNTKGIHVKFAKKHSGIPTISGAEAVEVALCFGWIDGRANSIDDTWWMVRYTPRRAKSIWSKKNVETVGRLIAATGSAAKEGDIKSQGKRNAEESGKEGNVRALWMRPAGLAAVEAAKQDGRWERAYAGPATIEVPADFQAALDNDPAAKLVFDAFNRSERYSVLWKVETASPKARPARIEALIQMLSVGKQGPGPKHAKKQKSSQTGTAEKANRIVKNASLGSTFTPKISSSSSTSKRIKKIGTGKQQTKTKTKSQRSKTSSTRAANDCSDDDDDDDYDNDTKTAENPKNQQIITDKIEIDSMPPTLLPTAATRTTNTSSEPIQPRRSGLRTRPNASASTGTGTSRS